MRDYAIMHAEADKFQLQRTSILRRILQTRRYLCIWILVSQISLSEDLSKHRFSEVENRSAKTAMGPIIILKVHLSRF